MSFSTPPNLLNLEVGSVHHIDTEDTLSLHTLWSIFRNCADTLQEGKRLENLSWRIYSRETFCVSQRNRSQQQTLRKLPPLTRRSSSDESIPSLASSLDSKSSSLNIMEMATPEERSQKRSGSMDSCKPLSPIDLENIVKSVTESPQLPAELPPLPPSLVPAASETEANEKEVEKKDSPEIPTGEMLTLTLEPESSTSTFDTLAVGSECSQSSNHLDLVGSSSTEVTSTSIVRGFSKDNISRSRRSTTQLSVPQLNPILKSLPNSSSPHRGISIGVPPPRKKAVFVLGSSEGEESSADTRYAPRSVTEAAAMQNRKLRDDLHSSMPEEAIEDSESDEDEDDWEDDNDPSEAAATEDSRDMFQRVSSSSQLTSRRSLITTMIHEKDRAEALQNAASQSSPLIRRSRSHVAGPMMTEDSIQPSRVRPIVISPSTSTTEPIPLLSPRTNRRNMLSTELTGSLRKHLLWERQQRNPASKNLKNRQFRSETRLAERNEASPFLGRSQPKGESSKSGKERGLVRNESSFYDNGALEYYEKGW